MWNQRVGEACRLAEEHWKDREIEGGLIRRGNSRPGTIFMAFSRLLFFYFLLFLMCLCFGINTATFFNAV